MKRKWISRIKKRTGVSAHKMHSGKFREGRIRLTADIDHPFK